MEIIVEYVLIDNIVINFLILYLSALVLRLEKRKLRLFIAACFGAIFSLITPLLSLPTWPMIAYKVLLGLVIARLGLKTNGFKKNALAFSVFLIMTAAVGGACMGIVFLFGGKMENGFLTVYEMELPVGVVLLMCSLVCFGIARVIKAIGRRKLIGNFIFQGEISNKGKTTKFDVFLDSGNALFDPISKKPVLIVELSVFSKIFDVPFEKIITKKIDENEIENSHYITYGTATGQSKMLVCEVENFCVSLEQGNTKEFQDVAVGLSLVKFQKCYDCRALMGAEFAKEFV